tara:strand:+ start:2866 stop:3768 length:903 start_codon:yes stop_codon:yes gene_type:complete
MYQYSFITPSRGRIKLFQKLIDSIEINTKWLNRIEIVVLIDNDDLELEKYSSLQNNKIKINKIYSNKRMRMGEMINACCSRATGEYVIFCNDDVEVITKNWDILLDEKIEKIKSNCFLFYANDGTNNPRHHSWPIFSKIIFGANPDIVPWYYYGHYLDTHIFDIFSKVEKILNKKLIHFLNDITFYHKHPLLGNYETDDTYRFRDSMNRLGVRLFLTNYKHRNLISKGVVNFILKSKYNYTYINRHAYDLKKKSNLFFGFLFSTIFSQTKFNYKFRLFIFFILVFLSNLKRKVKDGKLFN